ncbi:MAG: hypothetical protein JF615_13175 [Asticcacaulis sp.]|nr:hypothetical protein [Asticcacaulis sp.]
MGDRATGRQGNRFDARQQAEQAHIAHEDHRRHREEGKAYQGCQTLAALRLDGGVTLVVTEALARTVRV